MNDLNRIHNSGNPYQGKYKRVLCVCSAGLLRSPTAAFVFSNNPFGFNTRAAGIDTGHALIPVDDVLLTWADEVVCMDEYQTREIARRLSILGKKSTVHNLRIGDNFEYRDKGLMDTLKRRGLEIWGKNENV